VGKTAVKKVNYHFTTGDHVKLPATVKLATPWRALTGCFYAYWGFVAFLTAVQVYANFGPPPSSPEARAGTRLAFYAVLAFAAAGVERIASESTIGGVASRN
jgi:hypothetical protein